MKNERRKRRAESRLLAERFEAETREFDALPLELQKDMISKSYVLNSPLHLHPLSCEACGGVGSKERRGRPRGSVPCRVCQGSGLIQRRIDDGRLLGVRPNKVYWGGRRWWRHWSR
jgi:hypothetical protein